MKRAFLLAVLAGGCSCGQAESPTEPSPEGGEAAAEVTTIEGVVRLADGAELPSYPTNPMVAPHGRPSIPESCTPAQNADAQPVQQGERGLAGVLVALHDFARAPRHAPATHELAIRDCRLQPRLVVATRGDVLRIRNETDYPFLPDFGGGMMQALLPERTRDVELAQGGVRSLECGFAAPCGRAEVVTLYHPLHTVSEANGTFRIEGVPAGEEVRVSAWHPLFQEASQNVTVEEGETRRVELVLEPAPPPDAPPPVDEPDGPAEDDPSELF